MPKNDQIWSADEITYLKAHYPNQPASAIARALGRTRAAVKGKVLTLGLSKTLEPHDPATGRFQPGFKPWNKGKKISCHPNSIAKQFKPGTRQGRAAKLHVPVGSTRINAEGILDRKVNDDLPYYKRWRAEHVLIWEREHGALPKGHVIAFINGDKTDIRLENLECITRRELMARNTIHNLPEELRKTIRVKGALTRQINKRKNAA